MNTRKDRVYFTHPDREMLKNQLGVFLVETLMEYETALAKEDLDGFIDKRVDKFMRILAGKAGF